MDKERLQRIYRKTDGYCHICHCKLSFSNYAAYGSKGAWHIEHSIAKANGGSDHLNNLFAACIGCNLDKGIKHSRTARSQYGNSRAPYSKSKKLEIKTNNTSSGAIIGGALGLAIGGPVGSIFGTFIGGLIGNENSPRK